MSKIQEEAECLKDIFKSQNGNPIDPTQILMLSVSNVICSLLYGERFQHEDKEFHFLLEMVKEMLTLFLKNPECDYIWIYKLKPSYHQILNNLKKSCQALSTFNIKKIEERSKWVEREDFEEPRDFIEGYLKELKANPKGEGKMREDWLIGILNDLFLAGTETIGTTLAWAMILMAARQDIQRMVCATIWSRLKQQLSQYANLPPLAIRKVVVIWSYRKCMWLLCWHYLHHIEMIK